MRKLRINFYGPIGRETGYSSQSLGAILELHRRGHSVAVWTRDVGVSYVDVPFEFFEILRNNWHEDADVCLVHTVADALEYKDRAIPDWRKSGRKVIGWLMFEWTTIPTNPKPLPGMPFADWTNRLHRYCDAVIVPTTSQIEIFRNGGVQLPIHVVPDGIDETFWTYQPPDLAKPFTVCTYGYLNSRKRPLETLSTWRSTFPPDKFPDVRLVMKTVANAFGFGICGLPWQVMEEDPRITLHNALWPLPRIRQLIYDSHACIFLSAGEGFGNMALQTLACGRPTIAACHSGMADFVTEEHFYPVRTAGMEQYPPKEITPGYEFWRWEDDYEHAGARLLQVYNEYEQACAKARAGSDWARSRWAHTKQVDRLLEVLDEICAA